MRFARIPMQPFVLSVWGQFFQDIIIMTAWSKMWKKMNCDILLSMNVHVVVKT